MRIDELLSRLSGVKQTGPYTWIAQCPAHDDRNPSLSIRQSGHRILLYCFAGCSYWDIVHALDLNPTQEPKEPYKPIQPLPLSNKWRSMWEEGEPVTPSSPLIKYFQARGLGTPAHLNDLRFHHALPYYHNGLLLGTYPAMLALVRDERMNPVNVHRTYLHPSLDRKADVPSPKKLAPGSARGGIYLGPLSPVVVVAEGIETALAAGAMTGLSPVALISAPNMRTWVPPPWVTDVLIAGDADKAGVRAAKELVGHLTNLGVRAIVRVPTKAKQDWLDVLNLGQQLWV